MVKKDRQFGWQTLLLIPIGIGINFLGAKLVLTLGIPLFLDSVGTILAAAIGGFLPGVIVGFFSNYINSIGDPITIYYAIVSILFAIVAYNFSKKGIFTSYGKTLLSTLIFSVIGGGIGSVITWALYGFNFGSGISAPYAIFLHEHFELGVFWSQFVADMGIDLVDKLVTLSLIFIILRILPQGVLEKFELGFIYRKRVKTEFLAFDGTLHSQKVQEQNDEAELDLGRHSVRIRIVAIIVFTSVVLSSLAIAISYSIYSDTMDQRYIAEGNNAVNLMLANLSGDMINHYLADDNYTTGYQHTENDLRVIFDSLPDIKYMYVYRIEEDGCHVVFDLDTPDTPGNELGDVVSFDESFTEYLPLLLAGEEIEPVISNDKYGYLLTIYKPVLDHNGKCAAYAAVDVSIETIRSDRAMYLMRMISLLLGTSMIIICFGLWYAQQKLVKPITSLATVTGTLSYDNIAERKRSLERIKQLRINSGDEIEKLYETVEKSTEAVTRYIELLDAQNKDISKQSEMVSHLQDNIIISFANMVENRDENTGSHIKRTALYVRAIGEELMREGYAPDILTSDYLLNLTKSAPLHDIGKIKIPDIILNKPGKLTDAEFEIIKQHTTQGCSILLNVFVGIEENNYLSEAIDMATYHHEKWNGKGYPSGLAGEEIPLCARIMAIADVFDALVSKRSYKDPMPLDKAFAIIEQEAGTHFDPRIVQSFLNIRGQISAIAEAEF